MVSFDIKRDSGVAKHRALARDVDWNSARVVGSGVTQMEEVGKLGGDMEEFVKALDRPSGAICGYQDCVVSSIRFNDDTSDIMLR